MLITILVNETYFNTVVCPLGEENAFKFDGQGYQERALVSNN